MAVGGRGVSVRRLGGNRAGEIKLTRFLRNRSVTLEEMVLEASSRTSTRVVGRHILAIQDTTVIQSEGGGGHYLHAMMAVDAEDDAVLGLVYASVLSRSKGLKATRVARTIEEKESYRWLEGAEAAGKVGVAARQITVVADRESDIFEAFAQRPASVDLLIRAAQDRALEDGKRLFATIDDWPERGLTELDLPAGGGRNARCVTLAVRFGPVTIKKPKNTKAGNGSVETCPLNFIDVREVGPTQGKAGIHWRLLTTHRVDGLIEALAVVDLYRRRWSIEQLFRTLKTQGFDIEGIRIEEEVPRSKLVMAALVAAVSVQQLVHARDGAPPNKPLRPITDVFDASDIPLLKAFTKKLEGKTERQKNPHPEGSLAYGSWVCARLGGWTGYYGKPGPAVMLEGWLQYQDARVGALLWQNQDV
jgi:hypothetical protein